MGTFVIRKVVDCKLSADDWELYTNMDGAEIAAKCLNEAFEYLVNAGFPSDHVRDHMLDIMKTYSNLGAIDTEPRGVLEDLIAEVYHNGNKIKDKLGLDQYFKNVI